MKDFKTKPFPMLEELLGKPPLMKCDDPDQYRKLQKEVGHLLKPKDLFGALQASDLVNATWDTARINLRTAALVDVESRNALKYLASPKAGYVSKAAGKEINKYLDQGGRLDGMEMPKLLRKSGLSFEAVEAHAQLLAGEPFLALDKFAKSRTATRDALIKQCQKKIRADAKKLAARDKKRAARKKKAASKEKKRTTDNALKLVNGANNRPRTKLVDPDNDWN